jgi:hypothetical protein
MSIKAVQKLFAACGVLSKRLGCARFVAINARAPAAAIVPQRKLAVAGLCPRRSFARFGAFGYRREHRVRTATGNECRQTSGGLLHFRGIRRYSRYKDRLDAWFVILPRRSVVSRSAMARLLLIAMVTEIVTVLTLRPFLMRPFLMRPFLVRAFLMRTVVARRGWRSRLFIEPGGRRREHWLRLMSADLLLLAIKRRRKTVGNSAVIVVIHIVVVPVIGPRSIEAELLLHGLLRGSYKPEIVFRVLEIAFRHDRVAGGLGIAGELKVFFPNVLSGSPNFHVRSVRFIGSSQRIWAATIVTTTHALVLTWSHKQSLCGTMPPA